MLFFFVVVLLSIGLHNALGLSCYEGGYASNATQKRMEVEGFTFVNQNLTKVDCYEGTKSCMRIELGDEWIARCEKPKVSAFLADGAKCDDKNTVLLWQQSTMIVAYLFIALIVANTAVVQSRGFSLSADPPCNDLGDYCESIKESCNEPDNASLMLAHCPKTCNMCHLIKTE
ncbi:hypothetical protein QR680_014563 [Steinernema hermaphroditum]|uniref:ShKT domain-containing protein n=1 Tax=Steinernema hermaphroditum TaxID=289476 RepID=A0AA39I9B9_9BILA|nr:hypothetical protein QR680_014563 [Steinernema hermaphroditum]